MTVTELYNELQHANHSRESRLYFSKLIKNNLKLTHALLLLVYKTEHPLSIRAAWVLEFTCSATITFIIPHLDVFTKNLHLVCNDSALRPLAKICETLTLASQKNSAIRDKLTEVYIERIISFCFDMLIKNVKVATKAYSMVALFILGKNEKWIHYELKLILEKDYASQSAVFKARARCILAKMKA